jgi:hypothetical protein
MERKYPFLSGEICAFVQQWTRENGPIFSTITQKSAEGVVPQKTWEGLKSGAVVPENRRMRTRMYGGVRIGDREVP